jgi:electron transfer flavoprotein beta subunit
LKIVVCVKQVPDTAAKVAVDGGKVTWGDAPLVINPWDEYAVEAALQAAEKGGGTVTAISLGGEEAKEALKHALAMGCAEAVLVNDPALADLDTQGAARVLAAAIQKAGGVDLAVFGKQAIDGDGGVTAAQTARALGWPAATLLASLSVEGAALKGERAMEEGRQQVEAPLPAVASIVKDYGEPRYPSFMGIRKAAKAEIPVWTLADLGIPAPAAAVRWMEILNPPARQITNEMITGASPDEIANKLADKIMEEKVL